MGKSLKQLDKEYKLIKKGIEMAHSKPSIETIKMIDDLTTTIQVNCKNMENIEKKMDEGFIENSKRFDKLENIINDSLAKKADKWVEKVIAWVGITWILTMIGALAFLLKVTLYDK